MNRGTKIWCSRLMLLYRGYTVVQWHYLAAWEVVACTMALPCCMGGCGMYNGITLLHGRLWHVWGLLLSRVGVPPVGRGGGFVYIESLYPLYWRVGCMEKQYSQTPNKRPSKSRPKSGLLMGRPLNRTCLRNLSDGVFVIWHLFRV